MPSDNISVIKIRDLLMVSMPSDPDDATIAAMQEKTLTAMERHESVSLVLDISAVETFDSFFARTVSETARMAALMGGRTIIAGMRPAVAITATQLGLSLTHVETALSLDQAIEMSARARPERRPQ
jgi:rsbT antagonist protein RsbS